MDLVLLRSREEMEMERRGNTCGDGICMWREDIFLIFMGELLLMVLNMVGRYGSGVERLRITNGYIVQVALPDHRMDGWQRGDVL
jgi:hypothetical protein